MQESLTAIHAVHQEPAWVAGSATDTGLVRTNNEDSHGMVEAAGLFVVCDGMGGANAGEVASQLAVEHFLSFALTSCQPGEANEAQKASVLREAVIHANSIVYQSSRSNDSHRGMGCTLVGAWFDSASVVLASVGDSRIYVVRNKSIRQLTEDHSLAAEQVRQGLMTEEEAARSPIQSVITRAIGVRATVDVDLFHLATEPQDLFLLTTDGLMKHVTDEVILATMSVGTPQDMCARLIQSAADGGGTDNCTCIIVRVR